MKIKSIILIFTLFTFSKTSFAAALIDLSDVTNRETLKTIYNQDIEYLQYNAPHSFSTLAEYIRTTYSEIQKKAKINTPITFKGENNSLKASDLLFMQYVISRANPQSQPWNQGIARKAGYVSFIFQPDSGVTLVDNKFSINNEAKFKKRLAELLREMVITYFQGSPESIEQVKTTSLPTVFDDMLYYLQLAWVERMPTNRYKLSSMDEFKSVFGIDPPEITQVNGKINIQLASTVTTAQKQYFLKITGALPAGQHKDPKALAAEMKEKGLLDDAGVHLFNNLTPSKLSDAPLFLYIEPNIDAAKTAEKLADNGYNITLQEHERGVTKPGTEQVFIAKPFVTSTEKYRVVINSQLPVDQRADDLVAKLVALSGLTQESVKNELRVLAVKGFSVKQDLEEGEAKELAQQISTWGVETAYGVGTQLTKVAAIPFQKKTFDDLTPKQIFMENLKFKGWTNSPFVEKVNALPDDFDTEENARKMIAFMKLYEREIKTTPVVNSIDDVTVVGFKKLMQRIIAKHPDALKWFEEDAGQGPAPSTNPEDYMVVSTQKISAALKDEFLARGFKAVTQGVNRTSPIEVEKATGDKVVERLAELMSRQLTTDPAQKIEGLDTGLEPTVDKLMTEVKNKGKTYGWLVTSAINFNELDAAKRCTDKFQEKFSHILDKPRDAYGVVMYTIQQDKVKKDDPNKTSLETRKKHYCGVVLETGLGG